jgi:hypothetical protein
MVDKSNANSTIDFLISENNSLRNAIIDNVNGTITKEQLQRLVQYDDLNDVTNVSNVWWFNRKHRRVTKRSSHKCPVEQLHTELTADRVVKALRKHDYVIDERKSDYALNLVAIRTEHPINAFVDVLAVVYWYRGKRVLRSFDITTDASLGEYALAPGQYVDCFELRNYRGQYNAVCQKWNSTVKAITSKQGIAHDVTYGFNSNRHCSIVSAQKRDKIYKIEPHSALNQIVRDNDDFNEVTSLCTKHSHLFGNSFTYTLLLAGDI